MKIMDRNAARELVTKEVAADYVWWEDEIGSVYDAVSGPNAAKMKEEWEKKQYTLLNHVPVYDLKHVIEEYVRAFKAHKSDMNILTSISCDTTYKTFQDLSEKQYLQNTRVYHFVYNGVLLCTSEQSCRGMAEAMAKEIFQGATVEVCPQSFKGQCMCHLK